MHLPYHNKRIIIAPLNWGLGHATRCIPIIDKLLAQDNTLAIASDGDALSFLQKEYPSLPFFSLPSYNINYGHRSLAWSIALQSPKILRAIKLERKAAITIAEDWKSDIIVSDNRLGFRAKTSHNIYMTHQLNVLGSTKLQTQIATALHKRYYRNFDEYWVPDHRGESSLAGDLINARVMKPIHYLGPLSRLEVGQGVIQDIDIAVVLSGPEPQRTYLEEAVYHELLQMDSIESVIVRGVVQKENGPLPTKTIKVENRLGTQELNDLLNRSRLVVCRSGYSSIMDLIKIGKKAIIIPTPGQTEQEYLAKRLDGKHQFERIVQENIKEKFQRSITKMLQ